MPRDARLLLENVCYHVIARGNQKQRVFIEEEDYKRYLRLIEKYKIRYRFGLYGYCLMPNHIHLILDPREPRDLMKTMQGLNLSYSIWFNVKYNKVGHLWQDRFKSMIIQKDEYLIGCINYIENNPVRGNIVAQPLEYLWSSYKTRFLGIKDGLLDSPTIY